MNMTWNCLNCLPSNPNNTEMLEEELSNDEGVADDQEGVYSYHVLHT